jgi:hypothetical protein
MHVELTEMEVGLCKRGLDALLARVLYPKAATRMRADPYGDDGGLSDEIEAAGELADRLEEMLD